MTRSRIVNVVAVLVVVAAIGVTVLATLGRSDAQEREQAAVEREAAAAKRMPGVGEIAERLADPAASAREEALRAYFGNDVLVAVVRVATFAITSACDAAASGEADTAQEVIDDLATSADLPALVALPDDEWRAFLGTDLVEQELTRCAAGV